MLCQAYRTLVITEYYNLILFYSELLNDPFQQIVSITSMYSASIIDKATTGYKLAFQLTALPYIVNTYPVMDFLVSKLLA